MSQQNKTQLQSAINTDLADNTTGAISAADIRNNFINATDSLLFNSGSQTFDGTLTATAFSGDGSALTGVTGEWDGSLNGNAEITGSLTVTGDLLPNRIAKSGNLEVSAQYLALNSSTTTQISGPSGISIIGDPSIDGDVAIEGNTLMTGSLTVSGSIVDFTDATAISGSTFSGSFVGDGSELTGIIAEWDGILDGNASIDGNLDVTGSNINFVHPTLGTAIPTFTLKSTDGNPGFTIDSGTAIDQVDLYSTNKIFIEGNRGTGFGSYLDLDLSSPRLNGYNLNVNGIDSLIVQSPTTTVQGGSTLLLNSPAITIGTDSSSTTTMNGIFTTEEYTVSSLPASPATGSRAHVTDSTLTTFYSPVTGSGANPVPVFYNGTQWVIA